MLPVSRYGLSSRRTQLKLTRKVVAKRRMAPSRSSAAWPIRIRQSVEEGFIVISCIAFALNPYSHFVFKASENRYTENFRDLLGLLFGALDSLS
jgi:hypothetical protein